MVISMSSLAEAGRIRALEARIAELEKLIALLMDERKEAQAVKSGTRRS